MRFDVDRLSELAGVPTEGRRTLREASNRSYHDKDANDTADERFGKNQLSEFDNGAREGREPLMQYERGSRADDDSDTGKGKDYRGVGGKHLEEGDDEMPQTEIDGCLEQLGFDEVPSSGPKKAMYDKCLKIAKDKLAGSSGPQNESEDVMLEIDEGMLRREIIKMKRERLEETRLRGAIRNEIRDIFASLTNDSSWVYGDRKPKRSKRGSVHMGFPGIGFM
jgi:hypothetical protein